MTAQYQVKGTFALADTALAEDQHTDAEHIDQHAMDMGNGEQLFLEKFRHQRNKRGRKVRCPQERDPCLIDYPDEAGRGIEIHGYHEADNGKGTERFKVTARGFFRQLPEIGYLGISKDLDPVRMQMFRISGQGKTGFLDPGGNNPLIEPPLSGENGKTKSILDIMKKISDGRTARFQSMVSCS